LQRDSALRFRSIRRIDDVDREDRPHQAAASLVVVQNWFEELKRLAPVK
jgi:hypothetical protein